MFDLDSAVREWRERQQRESSLSPRELDELVDHLRARADLELELNAALAPEQAFAIAQRELGEPAVLSKEFVKAGRPRWRRWLAAGWAMYAATAVLPVLPSLFFDGPTWGNEMFRDLVLDFPDEWPLTLVNLAMVMTVPALWGARLSCSRGLRWLLGAVGVCFTALVAAFAVVLVTDGFAGVMRSRYLAGWWTWSASYICVANALRLRAKQWASARLNRKAARWLPGRQLEPR